MKRALLALALFLGWNVLASAVLLLVPAPWGVPALLFLLWLIVRVVLGRGRTRASRRRRSRARLRAPSRQVWGWTLAAAPLFLVTGSALGAVWSGLVEVPPDANPFLPLLGTAAGRVQVAVFVVVLAPVVEELFFRGLLQRPLERRYGTAAAVLGVAAVFGAMHLLPRVAPLLFALGVMLGFTAAAARSLWPAIALHALHNGVTLAAVLVWGEETAPTVWETGPTREWGLAVAVLAAAVVLWVPLGRRMWRAGHRRPAPA